MAFTSTWRQSETRGFRGLGALLVAVLLGLLALVTAVMFLWPQAPDGISKPVLAGKIQDLSVGKPVYRTEGSARFYLVRLSEDEVIALSPTDPHARLARNCPPLNPVPSGVPNVQGAIVWDTEHPFNDKVGMFRALCTGSRFEVDGGRIYGPAPRDMDRYRVTVDDSGKIRVYADENSILTGAPAPAR